MDQLTFNRSSSENSSRKRLKRPDVNEPESGKKRRKHGTACGARLGRDRSRAVLRALRKTASTFARVYPRRVICFSQHRSDWKCSSRRSMTAANSREERRREKLLESLRLRNLLRTRLRCRWTIVAMCTRCKHASALSSNCRRRRSAC